VPALPTGAGKKAGGRGNLINAKLSTENSKLNIPLKLVRSLLALIFIEVPNELALSAAEGHECQDQ